MDFQMETFVEHMIAVKKSWRTVVLQVLLVLTALSMTLLFASLLKLLAFFAATFIVGVWYGVWFLWKFFNIEYEYSLTGDCLDIDRIYGQKKRMNALSIRVKKFELMAKVTSDYYKKCREDKSIKTALDFSSHVNIEGTYFCVFSDDKGRRLMFFEPTEQMLDIIKVYIPRKLFR